MVKICYCLLQAKFLFLRILKARCATCPYKKQSCRHFSVMHAGTVSTKYGKERVEHVKGWLSTTFDIMFFFFQDNEYDFTSQGQVFDSKLFIMPTLLTVWFFVQLV